MIVFVEIVFNLLFVNYIMATLFLYTWLVFWYAILLMLWWTLIYTIYILLYINYIKEMEEYNIMKSYTILVWTREKNMSHREYDNFLSELRTLLSKYKWLSEK